MTISFEDLRKGVDPKPIVIKSYDLNGSKIVITNEETGYVAKIDGVSISDGYDNPLDAESSAEETVELLQKKAERILEASFRAGAKGFTPKQLNQLSDAMKLNQIQKEILFNYMEDGKIKQVYGGKPAG